MKNWMDGWPPPSSPECSGSIQLQFTYTYLNIPGPTWDPHGTLTCKSGQVAFVWAERPPR